MQAEYVTTSMEDLIHTVGAEDWTYGAVTAPVVLVEYGDLECPDCKQAEEWIGKWKEEFGEKFCLVFRHMPLNQLYPIHPNATTAACAAEAAGAQGKFWEMHDLLFANQDALTESDCIGYAELLGLDEERFTSDMKSEETLAKVLANVESGKANDVTSTPGFFLNGEKILEPREYAHLDAHIRDVLAQ